MPDALPSGACFLFQLRRTTACRTETGSKPQPKPMVDLNGDVEQQLVELFSSTLRRRGRRTPTSNSSPLILSGSTSLVSRYGIPQSQPPGGIAPDTVSMKAPAREINRRIVQFVRRAAGLFHHPLLSGYQ